MIEFPDGHSFVSACEALDTQCIAFNPVTFPAVPKGARRIRFCVSASHRNGDLNEAAGCLAAAKE